MVDYKFFLDGECNLDYGINLQAPITFGQATPKVETQSVPGRNGDLHVWDGSYNNLEGAADCFALDAEDVHLKLQSIHQFLSGGSMGYRRLETDEEPDVFRLARVTNLPDTEIRMRKLAPFSITFDCDPRVFMKDGEFEQEFSTASTLYNLWGKSLPLIHVFGSGDGAFQIGAYPVTVQGMQSDLYLDCETQDAYTVDGSGTQANVNDKVKWTSCPAFEHGENEISFSGGITKLIVTPRWCYV